MGNEMIKTKTYFGIMIIVFAFLITGSSIYFKEGFDFTPRITGSAILDENIRQSTQSISCSLMPKEKTIILRMDDLGAHHYYNTVVNLTEEILSREMSLTLGVIPEGLEKDRLFIEWISSIKYNDRIEIAQHGYQHTENEFKDKSLDDATRSIELGKESIIKNLGISPVTFVPPQNEYSKDVPIALESQAFKIMSAKEGEYKNQDGIYIIGPSAKTFDFGESELIPVNQIMEDCKRDLDLKNLCVITLHPQDYVKTNSPQFIDENKYTKFIDLLDSLEELDVKYANFNDLLSC